MVDGLTDTLFTFFLLTMSEKYGLSRYLEPRPTRSAIMKRIIAVYPTACKLRGWMPTDPIDIPLERQGFPQAVTVSTRTRDA